MLGTDNQMWHKFYDDAAGQWSAWYALGGQFVAGSSPAAAVDEGTRLVVYGRGTDNALWHKFYDNGWSSWYSLGGVLSSGPAAMY